MPKDSKSKSKSSSSRRRVQRGGAGEWTLLNIQPPLTKIEGETLTNEQTLFNTLVDNVNSYNVQPSGDTVLDILTALTALVKEINKSPAEESAATGEEGANVNVGGSRRRSAHKKKRGGGMEIDTSKLYNVSGLIVDSKDPIAIANAIGDDKTPAPFSASGQGIAYTGGISKEFMNDLNPTIGKVGGAKKSKKVKGKGKK